MGYRVSRVTDWRLAGLSRRLSGSRRSRAVFGLLLLFAFLFPALPGAHAQAMVAANAATSVATQNDADDECPEHTTQPQAAKDAETKAMPSNALEKRSSASRACMKGCCCLGIGPAAAIWSATIFVPRMGTWQPRNHRAIRGDAGNINPPTPPPRHLAG